MIRTNPFFQIEISKEEIALVRELTTHHKKNSIDIGFGPDCDCMRVDSQALSGNTPLTHDPWFPTTQYAV
jgi:hypothetical protein